MKPLLAGVHRLDRLGQKLRSPWPLWLRIFVALVLAMLVVSITSSRLGYEQRAEEIESQLKAKSLRTLEMLSAGALEAVISEDVAVLDTLVEETTRVDADLHSVLITNSVDTELVSWIRPGELPDNTFDFQSTIDFEGDTYGTIRTKWNPTRLLAEVDKRLVEDQLRTMAVLMVLTVLSLVLLHLLVTAPLSKIDRRLRLLSSEDDSIDYQEPLRMSSSREIAMLSAAVNELGSALRDSRMLAIELEYQATHDHLTDLDNRSSFETTLTERLQGRSRNSPDDMLLYFDLDQFKVVNDTCGHIAGDTLLQQLSGLLSKQLNAGETLARLGGDEFAVLLPGVTLERGLEQAEEIRTSVEGFRFTWKDRTFSCSTSIGAVAINGTDKNLQELFTAADVACYAAKSAGRNRVHVYQEDDAELSERQSEMSWVPHIRSAIENSNLVLFGQLIEPSDPDKVDHLHVEVLVRLLDEAGKVIPPGAFLPAAERYGLSAGIDRWVISHAIDWMQDHHDAGEPIPVCSINISGASVGDAQFRNFLLNTLDNLRIPCEYLCFEITETAAVANLTSAIEFMEAVKEFGCCFALDDFGAGMSSFTYLKNLPVDFIKIDGAFVRDMLEEETSLAMVRAIADIARVMKIPSIAEFVENEAIRTRLVEIGIDYVQGYGVGKPKALTEYRDFSVALDRAA